MASSPRIEELQKKFDENPRRYFAPLANEYRKAGDIDQAIFICQEYLPQQPGHMSGHIVYGQALFEARRYDEAKTVFETALSLDPENLIALRHLGDIAREQGDLAAARSWYLRVLDADPRNEEIASVLASLPEAPAAAGGAPAETVAGDGMATAEAPAASAPEPVVDVPLETEPTESPLADFASLVEEVRVEAAEKKPEVPAAELTVPHASTDSGVIDLDALDLSFGTAAAGADQPAPAAPAPSAPAEPQAATAPAAGTPLPDIPADLPLELDSPVPGTSPAGATAPPAVGALEGLESMQHEPPANPAAFAPLEGLDVLEDSFSTPSAGAGTVPPAASEPGPAAEAPLASEPAAPTAAPEAPPIGIGQAAKVEQLPPLPPEPMKTPVWGMPTLEVPGWEVAASPPPPTPPAPIPAVPDVAALDIQAELTAETEASAPSAPEEASDMSSAPAASSTPSAPAPFVTETMAELYVRQGHRDEAIAVYRQLVSERPDDQALRLRLAELESLSHAAAVNAAGTTAEAMTIRDFLAALAARRPRDADASASTPDDGPSGGGNSAGSSTEQDAAAPTPNEERSAAALDGLPVIDEPWSTDSPAPRTSGNGPAASEPPADVAVPMPPSAPADRGTVGGSIDHLFSNPAVSSGDEEAASTLADAFEPSSHPAADAPRDAAAADIRGQPARQAATELSLDAVFREPTSTARRSSTPSFSFDQFFSDGASDRGTAPATPEQGGPAQGGGAGTDDIEQFNAWLEGLKKS